MSIATTASRAVPRILRERSAVFLCDIQEKFRPVMWRYPDLINTAAKTLTAAQILDVPVFVTEQYPKGLGPTVNELTTILDKFPAGRVVVEPKTKFSMLMGPPADKFLAEAQPGGVKDVIIFGIESHVCVLQTVLDLREKGHNVFVLADGASSTNPGEIGPALGLMRSAGAVITTSESILFQLMADAKHPNFKAVSNLIKESSANTAASVATFLGPSSPAGRL